MSVVISPQRIVRKFATLEQVLKFAENVRPSAFLVESKNGMYTIEYHFGDTEND